MFNILSLLNTKVITGKRQKARCEPHNTLIVKSTIIPKIIVTTSPEVTHLGMTTTRKIAKKTATGLQNVSSV